MIDSVKMNVYLESIKIHMDFFQLETSMTDFTKIDLTKLIDHKINSSSHCVRHPESKGLI